MQKSDHISGHIFLSGPKNLGRKLSLVPKIECCKLKLLWNYSCIENRWARIKTHTFFSSFFLKMQFQIFTITIKCNRQIKITGCFNCVICVFEVLSLLFCTSSGLSSVQKIITDSNWCYAPYYNYNIFCNYFSLCSLYVNKYVASLLQGVPTIWFQILLKWKNNTKLSAIVWRVLISFTCGQEPP